MRMAIDSCASMPNVPTAVSVLDLPGVIRTQLFDDVWLPCLLSVVVVGGFIDTDTVKGIVLVPNRMFE